MLKANVIYPYCTEIEIFLEKYVNSVIADSLAPRIAWSYATMLLNV